MHEQIKQAKTHCVFVLCKLTSIEFPFEHLKFAM